MGTTSDTSIGQVSDSPDLEQLGTCPVCDDPVVANAYAVRYREGWHHVRCALMHERTSAEDRSRSSSFSTR